MRGNIFIVKKCKTFQFGLIFINEIDEFELKGGKIMARKKKKKSKKSKKSGDILIVQSKVRDYIKNHGDYNIGSDLFDAVSDKVSVLLEDAAKRASENGRKTVQARDV